MFMIGVYAYITILFLVFLLVTGDDVVWCFMFIKDWIVFELCMADDVFWVCVCLVEPVFSECEFPIINGCYFEAVSEFSGACHVVCSQDGT